MAFSFFAFGLKINLNIVIPCLQNWSTPTSYLEEIYVWFNEHPVGWEKFSNSAVLVYCSPLVHGADKPVVIIAALPDKSLWTITYSDGTQFIVHHSGTQVWATWPSSLTVEDTITYFLGPIMGLILRFRGITCLHASAILIEDSVVTIVGSSGSGKSTTAAAFAKLGYPILSDDIVALIPRNNQFWIQPAYPWVRLWPASVELLFNSPTALPRIVPENSDWDKRYLDLKQEGYAFQEQPMPLGGIYILTERAFEPKRPYFENLPISKALIHLIGHSYTNRLLNKEMRTQQFQDLSQVVSHVPVRQVYPHGDPKEIFNLCDAILDDFSQVKKIK